MTAPARFRRATVFDMHRASATPVRGQRDGGTGFAEPFAEPSALNEDDFDAGDIDRMHQRLEDLRNRHRDLDDRIAALVEAGGEAFQVMTLKREKLRVKDRIAWLASRLTPDIIA